jgi:hypothetical protein
MRIRCSLLYFLRQAGCRSRHICGFGLFKCAFIFFLGRSQIRVLQNRQQLAFTHLASPVSVKLFYRRADLWHQRRLLQRKQYSIRHDDALNGRFLSVRGGDRNGSFFGFLLGTADGYYRNRARQENRNRQPGHRLAIPHIFTNCLWR